MSLSENNAPEVPSTSNDEKLDDLDVLRFPDDIDWSDTLILRCDPEGAPYKLIDVTNSLHVIVRRNDVHNLGPTILNYVFTLSFKTERAAENFFRYVKDRRNKELTVKNRPCMILRIPSNCVTLKVRWIPVDIDTLHIVNVLQQYGKIVKTELVQNDKQGWFHVYTGERKFRILLNDDVDVNSLPFSVNIKGLFGAVFVSERNPKCLDCYYSGHRGESCKYRGCILHRET